MQKFEINVFIKILLDFFLWGSFFSGNKSQFYNI